jgi:hypothetical protein
MRLVCIKHTDGSELELRKGAELPTTANPFVGNRNKNGGHTHTHSDSSGINPSQAWLAHPPSTCLVVFLAAALFGTHSVYRKTG